MSKKRETEREEVYSGVPRGPYYKWYVEWLNSPEGRRVMAEDWEVKVGDIKTACPRGEPARKAEQKRQAKQ